jgi:PPK2 family polyphosphate:nucleotide phosphotransferase
MDRYRIRPDKNIRLDDLDPDETPAWDGSKDAAREKQAQLAARLDELQAALYAEHKHPVLIVIQAPDTGGKDGTIRAVFEGVNPQGVRIANFKAPTPIELEHDYLWRVHAQTPGKGQIVVFNRSHYEDVLVVRVHNLAPEAVWKKRYDQINAFERMLAEEGTTIIKFYLHISPEEQEQRLLERLEQPDKRWKFNPGDLEERKLWSHYRRAYQDMLNKTSTEWAPWYAIPANRNWYRNLAASTILVDALEKLNPRYPEFAGNVEEMKALLKATKAE